MESEEGIRLRKPDLKPVETKVKSKERDEEDKKESCTAEEEPVSPAGRMFHEPNFNVHVLAIMGSKYKIQPDVAIANAPKTLLKHPRFSSLLVEDEGGKMKWVRTEVDLNKHVVVPEIDPNIESPDKFVEDYIYNLTKTGLDKSKPLWEVHILNLTTSDAKGVAVFRIHHSLGDGMSLMSLLLACTRQVADPTALPTLPTRKSDGRNGGFIRRSSHCFFGIWWLLVLFWNTFVDVLMFMATSLFLRDTKTPISAPPNSELNPRRIVHKTVSFDDMKLVKDAMNMTINDVAVGITQAGLSKYLNRRYGEKNGYDKGASETKNNLPNKIRLRSVLLINIRPSAGIQELADMMEKDTEAKWGNWVGYILLPFDIGLRDDPLDYIRKAKKTIDRKKHSLEVLVTSAIANFVLRLLGIKRASAQSHKIFCNTTFVFSNLPGPLEEIGIYGHELLYLAPTSYGQPHALMVNFQSYINKMTIVLSVDENVFPDPYKLCDDIAESLKLVKDAVVKRGLSATAQN